MISRAHASRPGAEPWRLDYGARPEPGGLTCFRVWAPRAKRLAVRIEREGDVPMRASGEGEFEARLRAPPGTDYRYVLEGQRALPDPVSRWQPNGVHGASRVVDPSGYAWHDRDWRGLPLEELITCEIHVGTFTPEGTFRAAIAKLPYLRELGITAVEVMPVAEFPGGRNWGYDGAHLYAPQSSYGGPEGLKSLVDACHREGLALVLDVVYNHFGPEGNYLGAYGPYFSSRYRTPWGEAINCDGPDCEPVRRHIIDNALYWLTEYHVDALRLDAIHGIFDFSARHILAELREAFHTQARRLGRRAWLIAESDLNDTRVIDPPEQGGWGLDAQWSDDFHHALRAVATDNRQGYFGDFGRVADLAKALEAGFVYDGRYSAFRRRRHGNSAAGRPGRQFVVCTQNHDQIANGTQGRRLSTVLGLEAQKLSAALLLCAPNLPLLFMGQEYGETAPFLYFTSHGDPALAEAVTHGRREEMIAFLDGQPFPDPQDAETFRRSRLDWSLPEREPHAALLRWHRALIALRREQACLCNCRMDLTRAHFHESRRWLVLERGDPDHGGAWLFSNLSPRRQAVPVPGRGEGWRLALWSGEARFGGPAGEGPPGGLDREQSVGLGGWEAALYLRSEGR